MSGFVLLHRQIQNNPLWTAEKFSRGQAWVDLLLLANHKPGFFYLRDHKINLERGQIGWSFNNLAARWSWSRTKVKKFIKDLENEQQLTVSQSKSKTILTIVNYDKFQAKEQQKSKRKATGKQQKDLDNNDDKEKKDKEEEWPGDCHEEEDKEEMPFGLDFPDGINPRLKEALIEFLHFRKEKKKSYTQIGFNKLCNKWSKEDVGFAVASINESMANNWEGIFEAKNYTPEIRLPKIELTEKERKANDDGKRSLQSTLGKIAKFRAGNE